MAQSADPDPVLIAQAVEWSEINKLVQGGDFGASFSLGPPSFRLLFTSLRGPALSHRPGCVSRARPAFTGTTFPAVLALLCHSDRSAAACPGPTHLTVATVCALLRSECSSSLGIHTLF